MSESTMKEVSPANQSRFKRVAKKVTLILGAIFLLIQLVPVSHTNPPVTADFAGPDNVAAVLRQSCYDCHSNESNWPWYSYVAPSSWLVSRDVSEGRRHLNFSTWNKLGSNAKAELIHEIWEEVDGGEMPPWFYTPLHPNAILSDQDRQTLRDWAVRNGTKTESGETDDDD